MDVPASPEPPFGCRDISEILGRVGDKWTVLVVRALRAGPLRFNALKREVVGVSQQMLTRTLRLLERDGMVQRTVSPTTPPQVEYALTELGRSLAGPVFQLAQWAGANMATIHGARSRYDAKR